MEINKDIATQLNLIKSKLEKRERLNDKEEMILKNSYRVITGRKLPNGCKSCDIAVKIALNFLDKNEYLLDVEEEKEINYSDLLELAKERGFIKKGKGKTKISTLKKYIEEN